MSNAKINFYKVKDSKVLPICDFCGWAKYVLTEVVSNKFEYAHIYICADCAKKIYDRAVKNERGVEVVDAYEV